VDGKSPVEYLTADAARDAVRRVARPLLQQPVPVWPTSAPPGAQELEQ
jgi:hypothetical protein